ncbi:YhgE/Pip domain-containing protein [Clostridium botulinum]|uniref:YhgE/Pip domain-containing protein n=1 Tax=unclassified Clostridium TaxID=2614128 RepID=UPI000500E294|nr:MULTISPECIES: YhgE/Pip domain-containing protein [unclassified Clostridium]KFX57646.1 membrane protein [Clostridium botulinum]MBY6778253.1 YhgE/Pip domain-containing protein [Clostridium botulinum]MBY6850760.1 YhgE/Pip domain-containing protein [Clostridium botulinum]MBY7007103.1 YhgE/Pip domain-containing protein [Clostridium botulinum]NFF24407.1 YhgE/Pip domain-containing protein [Clostridium botulinum]
MKNIFNIYKRDIKNIITNSSALIVIIALCILPSLYAWFNIAASWDPYAQEATSKIKIGVVNKDKGAFILDKDIILGDEVIEGLKENDLLGWQFVSEEEANEAIKKGKYYATITIPEDFSKDMTSIITSDIKKGTIIYTVNEKINAIAPKLTDKGASGVQENVTKSIIETVSKVLLTASKEAGIELEDQIPKISNVYNMLEEIRSRFGEINETTDLAYDGVVKIKELVKEIQEDMPLIYETLNNTKSLSSEVENFISVSKSGLNDMSPTIKGDIKLVSEISKDISLYTNSIIDAINSNTEKAPEMINNLINKVRSLEKVNDSVLRFLKALNNISSTKPLNGIINRLETLQGNIDKIKTSLQSIKDSLDAGNAVDLSLLNNIKALADNVASTSEDIYSKFDTEILPQINDIFDSAFKVAENTLTIIEEAEKKLPKVENILDTVYKGADKGIEGITFVKEKLPEAERIINEITDKMKNVTDEKSLKELIDLLKEDVQERTDFLTTPVNLETRELYPMGNYGSAMTPFYSVLSLWVGLLLLLSILTVNTHGEYKFWEIYFGKLMLFMTLALIQSLIVVIGDLYLLKVYCLNPILLILGMLFTSVVFVSILYSAVSVFGNVGKVIGIVLLVLQIGGSGGTFPIELTPRFFQIIHPFLPFTYAISFAREAIGGVVGEVLVKDIIILLIYAVASILIAVFLKKPINKILEKFTKKFEESGLSE